MNFQVIYIIIFISHFNSPTTVTGKYVELSHLDKYATSNKHPFIELNRPKRSLIGLDTRFKLNMATYGNTFPFSSAVYFSHGCSGTLVTPKHVLTSATCFHNGRNFVRGSMKAKVGKYFQANQSNTDNVTSNIIWTNIKKISLPRIWTLQARRRRKLKTKRKILNRKKPFRFPYGNNYALVHLTEKLPGHPMPVGVFEKDKSEKLHMTTYNLDKTLKMLYRFCDVTRIGPEMLNNNCDADDNFANGAGVYVLSKRSSGSYVRKLVAVYTSLTFNKQGSSTVRITSNKRRQICLWVNERDSKKCEQFANTKRTVGRYQRHNENQNLNKNQSFYNIRNRKLWDNSRHSLLINEISVNHSEIEKRKLHIYHKKYPKQFKSKTVDRDSRKSENISKYNKSKTASGSLKPFQLGRLPIKN